LKEEQKIHGTTTKIWNQMHVHKATLFSHLGNLAIVTRKRL